MVDFNTSKVDGNTVAAVEWNQLADVDNFVITSGQTPSTSDLNQLGIASARYSSGGQFYTDSGTANAYVLSPVSPFKAPVDATNGYFNGMTIRFRAGNANTGASTVNVNSAGIKNLKRADGTTDLTSGDIPTDQDIIFRYDGTSFVQVLNPIQSGSIIKSTYFSTGAVATTTTQIPFDDTIPTSTEGSEFMTLAITPASATNRLRTTVVFNFSASSGAVACAAALFQDSGVSAIAVGSSEGGSAAGQTQQIIIVDDRVAGTTSPTTFRLRAGPGSAVTLTFNGSGGARRFGGVMSSSITIVEYKP